jgi:drug/metabolite transporter superfamily protein YnfA
MTMMLLALAGAAALEIGGDAAIRAGLLRSTWPWLAVGGLMLVAYGFVVNLNRSVHFGKLMGLYIAVFFVVSQLVSLAFFGEHPTPSLLIGGALIVLGGLVIHAGLR